MFRLPFVYPPSPTRLVALDEKTMMRVPSPLSPLRAADPEDPLDEDPFVDTLFDEEHKR